jgi:hypothetical protein
MEYKFSGIITLKDYIRFNKAVHKKRNIFMLILFGAWILFCFVSNEYSFEKRYFITFGTILVVLVAHKILFLISCTRYYNSNKFLQDEESFIINEEFIEVTAQNSHAVINKDKIYKILFDKDSIYLFTAVNHALIIKRRYLKSDNEFDELKIFLKEYYKVKK